MKTSLWKTLAALTLAAVLLMGSSALALARYPAQGGALTDDANGIGQAVAADIAAYAQRAENKTGVTVHVALVQFLDGEPVQTYADTLFTRWALGEDDVLLLGAAAEDTFAVTAGEAAAQKLSAASLKSLLYDSGFAQAFAAQRYDEAMGGFFTGLNTLLQKQYQTKIDMNGLFAGYAAQAAQTAQQAQPPQQSAAAQGTVGQSVAAAVDGALSAVDGAVHSAVQASSGAWNSTVNAITDTVNRFQQGWDKQDENGGGLTPGGWVVLAIIVLIVSRQGRRAYRSNRHYADAAREARQAREAAHQARQDAYHTRDAAREAAQQARQDAYRTRYAAYRTRDAARDAAHEVRDSAREAAREVRDSAREAAHDVRDAARTVADEACKWCGKR